MDVTKVQAAVDVAHKELNVLIDAEFAGRRLNALRTLGLAATALALVESHLKKAVQQVTPKEPKPATTAKAKK